VAWAGQRLVDGVVDDLVDHVMQAGTVIGVADIHARPLAHGVEAFQKPESISRAILDRNGMLSVGDRFAGQVLSYEAFEDVPKSAAQNQALISLFVP